MAPVLTEVVGVPMDHSVGYLPEAVYLKILTREDMYPPIDTLPIKICSHPI